MGAKLQKSHEICKIRVNICKKSGKDLFSLKKNYIFVADNLDHYKRNS